MAVSASVTERLADYVVGLRFEDVPSEAVERTKDHLVHHFGLAFLANLSPKGEQGIRVARDLSGGGGDSTILGRREKVTAADAVFANSLLMEHDGLDDFQLPGGCHPGVVTMPIALAVGERERSPGRELIVALLVGYDLMCKFSQLLDTWNAPSPRRPNSVFAPLGGAATAARLMRLSREATAHALAHGANASMCIVESSEFMSANHPQLARNGLLAAAMARAGIPMAPTMIEGRHGLLRSFGGDVPEGLDAMLASLGHDYELPKTSLKRYRSSGINIVPMQLTLDLVREHAIRASDIEAVTVALPIERQERESVWEDLYAKSPTPTLRSGILRFLLAVILADGRINPERYEHDPAPDLAATLGKVALTYESGRVIRYARVTVAMRDGRRHVSEGDHYVFPRSDWQEWLGEGGRQLLTQGQIERLIALVTDLDHVDDINEVIACTTPA